MSIVLPVICHVEVSSILVSSSFYCEKVLDFCQMPFLLIHQSRWSHAFPFIPVMWNIIWVFFLCWKTYLRIPGDFLFWFTLHFDGTHSPVAFWGKGTWEDGFEALNVWKMFCLHIWLTIGWAQNFSLKLWRHSSLSSCFQHSYWKVSAIVLHVPLDVTCLFLWELLALLFVLIILTSHNNIAWCHSFYIHWPGHVVGSFRLSLCEISFLSSFLL